MYPESLQRNVGLVSAHESMQRGIAEEACGNAKTQPATVLQGQERLAVSIDLLQKSVFERLLPRLVPIMNTDAEGVLKHLEGRLSSMACDEPARGQSEINRQLAAHTRQVQVVTELVNSIMEALDLP